MRKIINCLVYLCLCFFFLSLLRFFWGNKWQTANSYRAAFNLNNGKSTQSPYAYAVYLGSLITIWFEKKKFNWFWGASPEKEMKITDRSTQHILNDKLMSFIERFWPSDWLKSFFMQIYSVYFTKSLFPGIFL